MKVSAVLLCSIFPTKFTSDTETHATTKAQYRRQRLWSTSSPVVYSPLFPGKIFVRLRKLVRLTPQQNHQARKVIKSREAPLESVYSSGVSVAGGGTRISDLRVMNCGSDMISALSGAFVPFLQGACVLSVSVCSIGSVLSDPRVSQFGAG